MDITANCFCEILCFALHGFDLNTIHIKQYREKIWAGIQTRCCWVESKNASSVLRSPPNTTLQLIILIFYTKPDFFCSSLLPGHTPSMSEIGGRGSSASTPSPAVQPLPPQPPQPPTSIPFSQAVGSSGLTPTSQTVNFGPASLPMKGNFVPAQTTCLATSCFSFLMLLDLNNFNEACAEFMSASNFRIVGLS